jgi:20S proteasome alpha/beta subunit
MRKQRKIVVFLAVTLLLSVTGFCDAAWSQTTKQKLGAPVIRMAQMSGTYIGLYKACGGDAQAFRQHYENRVRAEARNEEERELALSLLTSSITRAEQNAGAHMTPARRSEACEETRTTDWHDFAKIIDDGLAGKWRY